METVVTGFNPDGFIEYGRSMGDSFARHWPRNTSLVVYNHQDHPMPARWEQRRLPNDCARFIRKYQNDPVACGTRQKPGTYWKPKCVELGYNFRFDTVKFCRMAFDTRDAARQIPKGVMAWFDGDVMALREIPDGFIGSLLPPGFHIAYLDRGAYHSETGFVGFRLPGALPVIEAWADFYETGRVFGLHEWHSAFVFDVARKEHPEVKCHNIVEKRSGHPWHDSPLGRYTDHLKGQHRKKLGYSPEGMK